MQHKSAVRTSRNRTVSLKIELESAENPAGAINSSRIGGNRSQTAVLSRRNSSQLSNQPASVRASAAVGVAIEHRRPFDKGAIAVDRIAGLALLDLAHPLAVGPDRVIVEIADDFPDLAGRLLEHGAVIGLCHGRPPLP